jgi:arsenate reductase
MANVSKEVCAMSEPYNVLFLCTGNSARSILAEAILNRVGAGKFKAYSAGSHPKGAVHPYTLQLLKSLNFEGLGRICGARRAGDEFRFHGLRQRGKRILPRMAGQPMTAHWGVPDPAEVEGTDAEKHLAFADAYRMLNNRISIFVSLPMNTVDKLALQKRLNEIGRNLPKAG